MATTEPKGTYAVADYFATPEGERWELVDGILYHTSETPGTWHQEVLGNLSYQYNRQDQDERLGVFWAGGHFAVVLSERNVIEPDLMFVKGNIAISSPTGLTKPHRTCWRKSFPRIFSPPTRKGI